MKSAIIHHRRGKYYIVTSSKTDSMIWVHDGSYSTADDTEEDSIIGEIVLRHVNRSRQGIPEPDLRSDDKELPRLANTKSWSAFYRGTKLVKVSSDHRLQVTFYVQPKGERGFVPDESRTIMLASDASPEDVGRSVRLSCSE